MWLAFLRLNVVGPTADEMKPPAKPMDWSMLNLEYRFYSLDPSRGAGDPRGAAGDSGTVEKSPAMLAEKKARFEHLVSVQTKSGQRAVTEEMQEVRFAAEYAPAARPTIEETSHRTATTESGKPKKEKPGEQEKDDHHDDHRDHDRHPTRIPNAEAAPGIPSRLKMRNVGVTVEVEPVVGPDGLTIDLNHVVQSVTLLGDLKTTGVAARYPAQPLFETRKITTSQIAPRRSADAHRHVQSARRRRRQ